MSIHISLHNLGRTFSWMYMMMMLTTMPVLSTVFVSMGER